AGDDDLRGIATECADVVANPLERGVLIEIAVVARMPALLARKLGVRHETERADAVIEAHEHGAVFRDVLAAIDRHARRSDRAAATVDEHDHRQVRAGFRRRRSPDVEPETVLARGLLAEVVVDVMRPQHLNALRTEAIGNPDAVPSGRLR